MKKINTLFTLILLFISLGKIYAQPHYYQSNEITVFDQTSRVLSDPFGGGLKFPVISTMDLNFDGKNDLILLDRSDNRMLTFINAGSKDTAIYIYSPQYESLLPYDITNFFAFRDYNWDGKPDIFCYDSYDGGGYSVYRNVSIGNSIKFQKVYFMGPLDWNTQKPQITQKLQSWYYGKDSAGNDIINLVNLYISNVDVPAILDVDGDSAIDILTYDPLGGSYLYYYRNETLDSCNKLNKKLCLDTFRYALIDEAWGNYEETPTSNKNILGRKDPFDTIKHYRTLDTSINNPITRHVGSTEIAQDLNGDGCLDILVGDVSYPNLVALWNGKKQYHTKYDTITSSTNFYPPDYPVNIHSMPAPFYQDVDNDGINDLLLSPMDQSTSSLPDGLNQIWYYKNMGTNNNVDFKFIKKNFLQEDMIDLGGPTSPAFFDYDGDGDLDLFVVTKGDLHQTIYKQDHIVLYENIGNKDTAIFRLKDEDYLGLSKKGYQGLTLAFGDIDGDGKTDLIMGKADGTLTFYKNVTTNDTAKFSFVTDFYQGIDVGDYSTPFIADINHDSLPDLIIGKKTGTLSWYKNTGTKTNPTFTKVTDTLGQVFFHNSDQFSAPAPVICDIYHDGHPDLLLAIDTYYQKIGQFTGVLLLYKDIDKDIIKNPLGEFSTLDTAVLFNSGTNTPIKYTMGRTLRPAVAHLTGDSIPDIILGDLRGGLLLFSNHTSISTIIKTNGSLMMCTKESRILDAGPGFSSYEWNTGQKTRTIKITQPGTYYCIVKKGSLTHKAYINFTAYQTPINANFTYQIINNKIVNFDLINDNFKSIYWNFWDGTSDTNAHISHTFNTYGSHTITVYTTDQCGGKDSSTQTINLINSISILIPSFVTNLYPNPSHSQITLDISGSLLNNYINLKIFNIYGRIVITSGNYYKGPLNIDISHLPTGIYYINVTDIKGNQITLKKFIKI